MSAFMVSDATINGALGWLEFSHRSDPYSNISRALKDGGYDLDDGASAGRLARDMFALNILGVDARYGAGQAEQFRPLDFKYAKHPSLPLVDAYSALQCWSYQCCEGDIPEENALYHLMERVGDLMARLIVSKLPEYKRANWG